MKSLLIVAAAAFVAGCAAPDTTATQKTTGADAQQVCGMEAPTGNLLRFTKCRRVADVEQRGEHDRSMVDGFKAAPPPPQ